MHDHNTKKGVWGKINIIEGRLDYTIVGGDGITYPLSPDNPGTVEPEIKHFVKSVGKVKFYVEFYKKED